MSDARRDDEQRVPEFEPAGTRRGRVRGVVGLAAARFGHRIRERDGQTLLSVGGVAVAVALLLVVTSVSAGLVTGSTVGTTETDYWIVPEGSAGSAVTPVEGQRLGQVHSVSDRLTEREDITDATPVLTGLLRLQRAGSDEEDEYVVVLGVIPGGGDQKVADLPTGSLTPGDPYYADGAYDGRWTGGMVLSESAADTLGPEGARLQSGTELSVAGKEAGEGFTVTQVAAADGPGIAQLPIAVVHLAELQRLTGGTSGDVADQVLVATDGSVSSESLKGIYPNAQVLTRGELITSRAQESGLPLAMAAAALLVALVVGTLFLVTTVGFSVLADAESRAVLTAIGVSGGSRASLVVGETLATAAIGGLAGVACWVLAAVVVAVLETVGTTVPFAARPVFGLYGLVVALGVGLVSLPPLVVVSRRTRAVREVLR
jgi:putative ABC transport system permease protein